jgi:hypothetical protein
VPRRALNLSTKIGFSVPSMRNHLGTARDAQNLDGNRLKGSLLRPQPVAYSGRMVLARTAPGRSNLLWTPKEEAVTALGLGPPRSCARRFPAPRCALEFRTLAMSIALWRVLQPHENDQTFQTFNF